MNKIAFEKLAAARDSEVRGAMLAFIDSGLVKVASEEAFYDLCNVVADNIGFDYDLQKIAAVTNYVLSGGQEKTAEEEYYDNMANLGELLLMKTAGEISDADFVDAADYFIKEAAAKKKVVEKATKGIMEADWMPGAVKKWWGNLKGEPINAVNNRAKSLRKGQEVTSKSLVRDKNKNIVRNADGSPKLADKTYTIGKLKKKTIDKVLAGDREAAARTVRNTRLATGAAAGTGLLGIGGAGYAATRD